MVSITLCGLGSRNIAKPGVRTGQPTREVRPKGVSQIGATTRRAGGDRAAGQRRAATRTGEKGEQGAEANET
jgi:hypothetical protein